MVYLYVTNVSTLQDPLENPNIMGGLSADRKNKILNCKQRKKRLQSFGAGLLLKRVLEKYDISIDALRRDSNGKPIIEGICFNLSHSGNLVICAVSDQMVGCDIEQVKVVSKRVAERMFSKEENEYLLQFSNEQYNREFIRIWTKKESYLKMLGVGIRGAIDKLDFKDCYIQEYELPEYHITVCAKEEAFSELLWEKI